MSARPVFSHCLPLSLAHDTTASDGGGPVSAVLVEQRAPGRLVRGGLAKALEFFSEMRPRIRASDRTPDMVTALYEAVTPPGPPCERPRPRWTVAWTRSSGAASSSRNYTGGAHLGGGCGGDGMRQVMFALS
ncbi:hypothetical protein LX36DRAFT_653133 [Colletotrichum falcatum]|nr:hypothetical protein LX36DRAFT_653133 [Colletotrichum falcatum]